MYMVEEPSTSGPCFGLGQLWSNVLLLVQLILVFDMVKTVFFPVVLQRFWLALHLQMCQTCVFCASCWTQQSLFGGERLSTRTHSESHYQDQETHSLRIRVVD